MTALCALNVSGTGVGDGFLKAATYGMRLRCWLAEQEASNSTSVLGHKGIQTKVRNNSSDILQADAPLEVSLHQWPQLELVYLRMQRTKITEASIPFVLSLRQIILLDIRHTEILGKSLRSIQAKYGLIPLPNNSKLLACSNSVLVATLHGACGCSAMRIGSYHSSEKFKEASDWVVQWAQSGVMKLLKEASRLRKRPRT